MNSIKNNKIPLMELNELENLIDKHFGKGLPIEDKNGIINELHELGFILDYSKWNLKKIIYDPQWLADLFRCIVSLKNNIKEWND